MDLHTAVAASLLPASRTAVAAALKALRHEGARGTQLLELLWAALRRPDPLGPARIEQILEVSAAAVENGERAGIHAIPIFGGSYPALLEQVHEPPPVLWTRGRVDVLCRPAVAIVGSRAASAYALQVASRLAAELAAAGVIVVSGLARGVDSAAHRGCLDAGGATIAVLGGGVDRIYPPEHGDLAARIAENGLVGAELQPGAPPLPEHFPLRNRIISGMSLATVVVEASDRSGSLITARYALEQGREVMAVPGSILSGRNRGSHGLLKDGAKVVESADDILQEIGLSSTVRGADRLSTPDDPVLAQMDPGEPYDVDRLVRATGLAAPQLLSVLTELELKGLVEACGGVFVRRQAALEGARDTSSGGMERDVELFTR